MVGLLASDYLLVTDPSWPGGGEYRGIDAYRRFMAQFLEAFGGIRFQSESEPEAIGDFGLFQGRWLGLGAASGIETVSEPFWVLVLARDGKVSESRFFFGEAKAREHATSLT
jgi:hypothetical protein